MFGLLAADTAMLTTMVPGDFLTKGRVHSLKRGWRLQVLLQHAKFATSMMIRSVQGRIGSEMTDELSFKGRRVVVTGAASGIGLATAAAFAERGARLALLDVDEERLVRTARTLPGEVQLALRCDVCDVGEIAAAFGRIGEELGGIDVLVNNAGINPQADATTAIDEAFYDLVMGVNVKGLFFCAREAIPMLRAAGGGTIVNMGSVSGMIGWGGSSVYSASKGAVIALTKFLAVELAADKIRVNAVCPGSIRTPMVEQIIDKMPDPERSWQETGALHPIGRVGAASEVADAILYLASPLSSFVTGTCLVVDGGLTAK
jgi:NAD(P)-dependent dehydrogenase (short-subunit alcohol dehydrogenase family)